MRMTIGAVLMAMTGVASAGACDLPPYIPPYEAPDTNVPVDTEVVGDVDGCDVQPTLSDLRAKYFSVSCVFGGCHESKSQEGELDLETADVHAQLVGVPAAHEGAVGKTRVVAFDPDASFLVQKLEDTQERDEGGIMPDGSPEPIDPECRIRMVRQWIADGALDN